jgi:hypothetical protein
MSRRATPVNLPQRAQAFVEKHIKRKQVTRPELLFPILVVKGAKNSPTVQSGAPCSTRHYNEQRTPQFRGRGDHLNRTGTPKRRAKVLTAIFLTFRYHSLRALLPRTHFFLKAKKFAFERMPHGAHVERRARPCRPHHAAQQVTHSILTQVLTAELLSAFYSLSKLCPQESSVPH